MRGSGPFFINCTTFRFVPNNGINKNNNSKSRRIQHHQYLLDMKKATSPSSSSESSIVELAVSFASHKPSPSESRGKLFRSLGSEPHSISS